MYEDLKKAVCEANLELRKHQLVIYSWGNVSGIDREAGVMAIKPSGVSYDELIAGMIVVLNMDGKVVEGDLRPSSDTPTHLELYRHFEDVGGICHTHSPQATAWAQAGREIPCFGTTHADFAYGPVPLTGPMTDEEIKSDYETNTGRVIVRRYRDLEPLERPAVLVAGHGPFTWGKSPAKAVENAVVLEEIASMALKTIMLNPEQGPIGQSLLDKHYLRKYGKNAYYGQR